MVRGLRDPEGGIVYHVLNRGNDRKQLFFRFSDYQAFLAAVAETRLTCPIRILDYCVMPNHWHFIVWPELDGQLSAFMHRLTTTHAARWNAFRERQGTGHVYQGPYKFFPIQSDGHLMTVSRYVVRNALRANLVTRAEDWFWSSLHPTQLLPLDPGPLPKPSDWVERVNRPLTEAEHIALHQSLCRGAPFGDRNWSLETARQLGIVHTLRGPGRPRKAP